MRIGQKRYWVSVATLDKALGVVVTYAHTKHEAAEKTKHLFPGLEGCLDAGAMVVELPPGEEICWIEDRLITEEELKDAGRHRFMPSELDSEFVRDQVKSGKLEFYEKNS